MSLESHDKQKSLKRRFLLLGVIRLVCTVAVGLLILFWKKIDLNITATQRTIVGILFIVYGVLRFFFSYKNAPDQ